MLVVSIISLLIALILGISAIISFTNKNESRISFKESMDLVNLPIITVMIKGKKLNLLLDTGSDISHLNSNVLDYLKYNKTDTAIILNNNTVEVMGMEGNKTLSSMCKLHFKYKNRQFNDEFSLVDLTSAFSIVKQESGVQIHGILGNKFFEKYKYVLDFKDLIAYTR